MLIHIRISGRVQGVGFRAWACRKATDLSLSGWVRNRSNGSVELMAEGSDSDIDFFLSLCRKGPLFARVDKIEPVSYPDAFVPPIQKGVFIPQGTV